MIQEIALLPLFSLPLIVFAGVLTLLAFFTAAYVGRRALDPAHGLPIRRHILLVRIAFVLALIHALFGLSLFFYF